MPAGETKSLLRMPWYPQYVESLSFLPLHAHKIYRYRRRYRTGIDRRANPAPEYVKSVVGEIGGDKCGGTPKETRVGRS